MGQSKLQIHGFVYAIQTAPGRIKLGFTKDVAARVRAILGHAGEAVLLRAEPAVMLHESLLHRHCAKHRITNEFFRYEGRVAEYVAGDYSVSDLLSWDQIPDPLEIEKPTVLHESYVDPVPDYEWTPDVTMPVISTHRRPGFFGGVWYGVELVMSANLATGEPPRTYIVDCDVRTGEVLPV